MLLDYHSYSGEPERKQVPWVPQPTRPRAVRGPERVVEREPEPEPERQVVRCTVDIVLPMLQMEAVATASVIPPTPITDIDLDAQEDGWTDERLLMAAMQVLLDDEDD